MGNLFSCKDEDKKSSVSSSSYSAFSNDSKEVKLKSMKFSEPKALRFSPDDRFLAVACGNGKTFVLDVEDDFVTIQTFVGHFHSLVIPEPIDFSEDGTRLLISAPNKKMQIIDTATWKPVYSSDIDVDSKYCIVSAAFRPSMYCEKYEFACGNQNRTFKIVGELEKEKPKLLHSHDYHGNWICCLKFNKRGDRLYSGSIDQTIVESDAENGYVKLREVVRLSSWCCNFSDIFPDGERIACGSWDKEHSIVNLKDGEVVSKFSANSGSTYDLAITHSKSTRREPFVISACGGLIAFSDPSGEKVAEPIKSNGNVYSVTCSHNNKLIAAGNTGGFLEIYRQFLPVRSVAEDRMPAFKLRMLSKGKMREACEIYNVTVLIALYLA